MDKPMTASEITNGQIDGAANQFRDATRKHRDEISKDAMQQVLGVPNLGMRLFAVIRALAEEVSKHIIRVVKVDRSRTPQQALDASGRKQYVDKKVVAAMPRGTGDKAKLVYFKPDPEAYKDGVMSCATLAEEYKKRGLKPDPQAQVDDNAANPEFADTTPNTCQWVDEGGNFCYASFSRWLGERLVYVNRLGRDWHDGWSFAGVPDGSSASAV